jgi:hypothetical protein
MLEKDYQDQLIAEAHTFGWFVAHSKPCRLGKKTMTAWGADGKGFPDLTLVHPKFGIWFREIKQDANYPTVEQRDWGRRMHDAGGNWAVWKPRDHTAILEALQNGAGPQSLSQRPSG